MVVSLKGKWWKMVAKPFIQHDVVEENDSYLLKIDFKVAYNFNKPDLTIGP